MRSAALQAYSVACWSSSGLRHGLQAPELDKTVQVVGMPWNRPLAENLSTCQLQGMGADGQRPWRLDGF